MNSTIWVPDTLPPGDVSLKVSVSLWQWNENIKSFSCISSAAACKSTPNVPNQSVNSFLHQTFNLIINCILNFVNICSQKTQVQTFTTAQVISNWKPVLGGLFWEVLIRRRHYRAASSKPLLLGFCGAVSSSVMMLSGQTVVQILSALTVYDYELASTLCDVRIPFFLFLTWQTEKKLLPCFQAKRVQDRHLGSLSPSPHSLTHPSQGEEAWMTWHVKQGAPEIHRTLFTKAEVMASTILEAESPPVFPSWLIYPHSGCCLPLWLLLQTVPFLYQEIQYSLAPLFKTDRQISAGVWDRGQATIL